MCRTAHRVRYSDPTDASASNTQCSERHHCTSRTGVRMRSGAYASSRQDTDYAGGVVRSFDPGSVTRGTACLASVCAQGDLKAVIRGQARRSSIPRSSPIETFEEALKSRGTCG